MNPILSIIIPSYNAEATLETTLESVIEQNFQDWEAIIVNDGSIDKTADIALKWLNKDQRFKYFFKQNGGLGKARNFGIKNSRGKFILPLDSDNQLLKDFTEDAMDVFEKDSEVGVVYGDAEYFGEKTGLWKVEEFNFEKMLSGNYIDACAVYRKELWDKLGGYDENMPHQGHEDWELWIAIGNMNIKFYHLNQTTFKYYVSNNSMIRSFTDEMLVLNQNYIVKKYAKLYFEYYSRVVFKSNKTKKMFLNKLKSEKFVINLFCSTFFGFKIFKNKNDEFN